MKVVKPHTLLIQIEEKDQSPIILAQPELVDHHGFEGTVIATGPGTRIKEGEKVLLKPYTLHDGHEHKRLPKDFKVLICEEDILCRL